MAKIYFAKMNINDEIYEVYSGEKKLKNLLQKIYIGINNKIKIKDEYGATIKFFDLDKGDDNSIIVGRLGYIKEGVHSSYDPDKDTAIDIEDKNKIEYITFYFDVHQEMLAFTVNPQLTRKKVLIFVSLLIKESTDIGVQFILESNMEELEKELKKIKVLKKVSLKLVPPNGDKEDFQDLFSLDADNLQEGNATQIKQEYSTRIQTGLKKDSKLIEKSLQGIALGYAEASFVGNDSEGEPIEIKTKEDTPYIKVLKNNQTKSKSIILEKAQSGIVAILAFKTKLRMKKDGEQK